MCILKKTGESKIGDERLLPVAILAIVCIILFTAVCTQSAFAAAPNPGHDASEISGGTFSSNDGDFIFNDNVGIGTSSPSSNLSVGGNGVVGAAIHGEGNNSIYGRLGDTINNAGGYFYNSNPSSLYKYGILSEVDAAGTGVRYGIYGSSTTSGTGTSIGVYGYGKTGGVVGTIDTLDTLQDTNFGVYGAANNSVYGILGKGGATGGTGYGAYGKATNPSGIGVYGIGTNYGVYGCDNDNCANIYGVLGYNNRGVYGVGTTYGIYGSGNTGVYGIYSGDSNIYGSLGLSSSGVYGQYNSSITGQIGTSNSGGYFINNNPSSIYTYGVQGITNHGGSATKYGVSGWAYGSSSGPSVGVYGEASGNGNNYAIRGKVEPGTGNYSGYFEGNVSSDTDFCIDGGNCLSTVGGGSMTSWTVAGNSGSETVTNGETLNIVGSTDGIDTVEAVTSSQITIYFDGSEVPADDIPESAIDFDTSCGSTSKLYVSGNNLACNADDDNPEAGDVHWSDLTDVGTFTVGLICTYSSSGSIDCNTDLGDVYINEAGDSTGAMTSDLNLDSNTFVLSYDDNRVGIGTTTPGSELHVGGTTPAIRIGDDGAEDTSLAFMGNAQDFYIGLDDTTDDLTIGTGTSVGSNVRMVVENGGNVGIGTTNPTEKLSVLGNFSVYESAGKPIIRAETGGGGTITIGDIAADGYGTTLTVDGASSGNVIIENGDVGIGTTNPGSELHVGGTTPEIRIGDDGAEDTSLAFMGNAQDFYIGLDDTTDDLTIGTGTSVGSNVSMVVENGGNVGIGTNAPSSLLNVVKNVDGVAVNSTITGDSTDGAMAYAGLATTKKDGADAFGTYVFGDTTGSSAYSYGVFAESYATGSNANAYGVYAQAASTSGSTYAVFGKNDGGNDIEGYLGGSSYGAYGQYDSNTYGYLGSSTAAVGAVASGTDIALYGFNSGGTAVRSYGSLEVEYGGVCIGTSTCTVPTDGSIYISGDITNVNEIQGDSASFIQLGGCDTGTGNCIADTPSIQYATGDEDLYIQGELEVDGRFYNIYGYSNAVSGSYTQLTSTGAFGIASSSKRFKENITNLDFNYSKLLDMQPREFDWNISSDKPHDVGFIAEELDALGFDKIVDYDLEGKPYAVDYPIITVYLVGLAKEQNQAIENLKEENALLKEAVCELNPEARICQ